jgi:NTP pyrophosphatase (non-canonical NTP hydrolase)
MPIPQSLTLLQAAQLVRWEYQHLHPPAEEIDAICRVSHAVSVHRGWWRDPASGEPILRNFGEMIALMHSELSEALEAHRKGLVSEHLPGFSGLEEEFADLIIRLGDCAAAMQLRVGEAWEKKMEFNLARADHSAAARLAPGGKLF